MSDETLAQAISSKWINCYGPPIAIWSDNASNFRGTFFTELNKNLGIKHFYSPPYNPQANGQAESTVKKYKSLLKILTYKNPEYEIKTLTNWIQGIINSTPTIALKMSSIEALTGEKCRTNYDIVTNQEIIQNSGDWVKLLKSIKETINQVNEQEVLAIENKKKSNFRPLRINQLVKIRLPPNKQIPNPLSKYTYRIQQISPEGSSFTIQDLKGRTLEKKFQANELQRVGTTI